MSESENPLKQIEEGELSEEEIKEYRRETKQKLEEGVEESIEELNEQQRQSLDELSEATRQETDTVTFNGKQFEVHLILDKETKDLIDELRRHDDDDTDADALYADVVPKVLEKVIASPDGYRDRDIWRAYRAEFGNTELVDALIVLCGPALERLEKLGMVRNFRDDE